MSEERLQPLEPPTPEPQIAEALPNLIVQPNVDRRKLAAKKKIPPRFGIIHILLWTACWGVYITVTRRYLSNDPGISSLLSVGLFGVGYSAALLGLAICLTRRIRGEIWPIEPGEWLLVFIGARFALNEIQMTMLAGVFTTPVLVYIAIRCALPVLPLLGESLSPRWRNLFLFLVIAHVSTLAIVITDDWLHVVPDSLKTGAITLISSKGDYLDWLLPVFWAAIDYRNRKQYTWLHWLGIATGLWLAGCNILALVG